MLVPKVLLLQDQILPKIGFFFGMATLAFLAHLVPCPIKNNVNEVPRWFSNMWVPKVFIPLKIRMFGSKRTFLHQNLQFWSIGADGVGWLAVGCGTRAAPLIEHFPMICYFDLITAVTKPSPALFIPPTSA